MGLRFFKRGSYAEPVETGKEAAADFMVRRKYSRSFCRHHDTVGYFLRMEDGPPAGRPPNDIESIRATLPFINLFVSLVPPQRDGKRVPTIYPNEAGSRGQRSGKSLVVHHVVLPPTQTRVDKMPGHHE